MQGFYQIAAFATPKDSENMESGNLVIVDYIIISRRSRDRAGLRYQRRGIDDDANVANFVETETIMRVEVNQPLRNAVANVHDVLRSAKVSRMSLVMYKSEDRVGISLYFPGSLTDWILFSSVVLEPARIQFEACTYSVP